ncbi:MAG: polysaccharide biosynthesis/export family protein, partial [Campylobacterota bacterium]|nr:polysaccharide biosynthesis/export family protein [Campylobacterota bacterium]
MNKILMVMILSWSLVGVGLVSPAAADDYVIGAGDVLQVSVWGASEFSIETPVRPDGKMTLPAVGDVVAEGFTPEQLSKKLEEMLRKFIKRPIVTLSVTQITNNKIYISGGGVGTGV